MTFTLHDSEMKSIDDVAQLLNHVVDARENPSLAHDLIEEISQLLWVVSSLDPDAEGFLLKHSNYVADLAVQSAR